jgi:hypothetical protein
MSGIIATRLAQKTRVCNSKMKVWWRCGGEASRRAPNASQMTGRQPMLERDPTELDIPSHEASFIGPMPATTHRELTIPVRLSRHARVPRAGPPMATASSLTP